MTKTIYIFCYKNDDRCESDYIVAPSIISDSDLRGLIYKKVADNEAMTVTEARTHYHLSEYYKVLDSDMQEIIKTNNNNRTAIWG